MHWSWPRDGQESPAAPLGPTELTPRTPACCALLRDLVPAPPGSPDPAALALFGETAALLPSWLCLEAGLQEHCFSSGWKAGA